jgi:plastocyanin
MKSVVALSGALLVLVMCSACGGSGSSYGNSPTSPTPPTTTPPASGATQIGILGQNGASSFTPNPASVTQGQMMQFKNNDGVTHRIVANDGSFDTGNLNAGSSSSAIMLSTNGTNYHCSIHPTMVGSINQSTGAPPPCEGQYCY